MTGQGVISKTRAHSFFPVWVRDRELRQRSPLGHSNSLYKSLYSSISPCHSWEGKETSRCKYGGVYSLDFSPDGIHLLASSENSLRIFDPLSRRLIRTLDNVHTGFVTHVKFLDTKIFATGGITGEVFLWDIRNLKSRFRALHGHSSSVENIEFSRNSKLLITSAFDGIIYIWDIKNWNQKEECNKRPLLTHAALCLRLNADETKMILSTRNGYFVIVHQLDLNTLVQDLVALGLGMSEFAFMQQTVFASFQKWSSCLTENRRRNRVEMVADFPNARDCNVVSALEMHPRGWSVISRCKNKTSGKEWTCVHDIQEREPSVRGPPCPQRRERIQEGRCSARGGWGSTGRASVRVRMGSSKDCGSELTDAELSLERSARNAISGSVDDSAQARSPRTRSFSARTHPLEQARVESNPAAIRVLDHLLPRLNPNFAEFNRRIHARCPRLTHYIQETYFSDRYIDSLGVSADGRLVSSPLKRGIRLLAFSPECSETVVSGCGTKPRLLYELSTFSSHSDIVFCTKFSPRHCLLVCGGGDGDLAWFQPVV